MRNLFRQNAVFISLSLVLLIALGLALLCVEKGDLHLLLCNHHTPARDLLYAGSRMVPVRSMRRHSAFRTTRRRTVCIGLPSVRSAYHADYQAYPRRSPSSHLVCGAHAGRTTALSRRCPDELLALLPFRTYDVFLRARVCGVYPIN